MNSSMSYYNTLISYIKTTQIYNCCLFEKGRYCSERRTEVNRESGGPDYIGTPDGACMIFGK